MNSLPGTQVCFRINVFFKNLILMEASFKIIFYIQISYNVNLNQIDLKLMNVIGHNLGLHF